MKNSSSEEEVIDMTKAEKSIHYEGGEWVRGSLVGKGSNGSQVHVAHFPDPKTKRFLGKIPSKVAVKTLPYPLGDSERKIMERLGNDCPHIVRCFGGDVTLNRARGMGKYLSNVFFELATGGNLGELVRGNGGKGLEEREVAWFAESIVRALCRVHEMGLAHRDVKLDNVLLFEVEEGGDKNGHGHRFIAKLADFGLAQESGAGGVGGSVHYLSPETVQRGIQRQIADIWALGIVVLEMLTGKPAWHDHLKNTKITKKDMWNLISRESPTVPRGVFSGPAEDFVLRCLERDALKRPSSYKLLNHPFVGGSGVGFE